MIKPKIEYKKSESNKITFTFEGINYVVDPSIQKELIIKRQNGEEMKLRFTDFEGK